MSNIAVYPKGTTDFFNQGLGVLSDVISSETTQTATKSGNVQSELELSYPAGGVLSDKLIEGNFLRVSMAEDSSKYGVYEIVDSLKDDAGTLTIYGAPYSDRIGRMSFDNGGRFGSYGNVQNALDAAKSSIKDFPSWFQLTSNLSNSVGFADDGIIKDFATFLDLLNQKVSGNIFYGVNTIQIFSALGKDRTDITLRDDRNTSSIKVKTDYSSIINRVIPVIPVRDANGNATQETYVGTIVNSKTPNLFIDYWAGLAVQLDTQELADSYFDRTHADRPVQTVDVDPIGMDEDFSDIDLFDRIQLYSTALKYTDKLRVSKRVVDNLTGRVISFSLGNSSATLHNSIQQVQNDILNQVNAITTVLISANGKNQTFTGSIKPEHANEGDSWIEERGDYQAFWVYKNGEWVKFVDSDTQKDIADAVAQALVDAELTSQQITADLDTKIQGQLTTVNSQLVTINSDITALDTTAQGYANKALADAKADTQVQVAASLVTAQNNIDSAFAEATEALDAAKTDLTKSISDETAARTQSVSDLDTKAKNYTDAAKTDLTKSIADETAARTQAVFAVDTKAQGYATTAKNDAIAAATTADGVINKRIDDSVDSITSTISQNKADADGKITTAQTTATQALNGLSTKVDTTTYNAKTNQLTTDLNTTTTTANKAATDIVSIKSDNVKQDARMLTIEQTADGQKTTISSIQTTQGQMNGSIATLQSRADGFEATVTKVENMGGINQLFNTEFSPDFAGWYAGSSTQTGKFQRGTVIDSSQGWFIGYGKHNGSNVLKKTLGVGWNATYSDLIPVGETSILTATIEAQSTSDYNGSVTAAIYLRFYDGSQNYISTLSKDTTRVMSWGRHISTVTVPTGAVYVSFNLLTNGSAGVNYYSQPMLSFTDTPMDYVIGTYNNNQAVSKAQLTADNATISINNYKTDADGRISKAQADIVVNTNAIATKVSQTVYDAKTGQLQTDLNTTTTTANKATTDIVSIKSDNVKQDARMLTIEQTADGQKTTISSIQTTQGQMNGSIATLQSRADGFDATVTKVNNMVVGGRNLLLKSKVLFGVANNGNSVTTAAFDATTNMWHITAPSGDNRGIYFGIGANTNTPVPAGQPWSFSIDVKGAGVFRYMGPEASASYSGPTGNVSTDWSRVSSTGIRGTSNNFVIYFNATTTPLDVYLKLPKYEQGNLPSGWSPAPEDVDSATAKAQLTADQATTSLNTYKTDADGRISKAQADITVTANEVKTKVSQTDYNTKTADLTTKVNTAQSTADGAVTTIGAYKTSNDGRVASAESKITQNTTAIGLRVLKTDYDANNNTIDGKFAAINVTTDGITSDVSKVTKATFWQPPNGYDLNAYLTQGSFFFNNTTARTGSPSTRTDWMYLVVEQGSSSRVTQVAWYDQLNDAKISYKRQYSSGSWSPWYINDNDSYTNLNAYKTSNDGRITTAESKITQNTTAIGLRVLKTDYDSNNNTINGKFAAIDVTTDKITQSVSDVTNKVNAMGQINQLFNTEFSPDFAGWGYWDADMKKSTSNITNSRLVIGNRYKGSNKILTDSSIDARYVTSTIPISISSNQPMVARVTADSDKAGSTLRLHISFHDVNGIQTGNVNTVGNLTTTPQDIVVAFNGPLPANTVSAYLVVMVVGKAAWAQPMVIYGDTIGAYTPGAYNSTQKIAAQQITIDSITNIVSNPTTGLSKRVQTAEGTLSQVTGADIPALQKATFWQPFTSLDFNTYTKQGSFFFNSTAAKPNGPTTSTAWTYLMVEQGTSDNGRIKQTAWYDGVTGVKISYVRTLNSGTWSPWYANDNDSVTTIAQTNGVIQQEITNRATGDTNTLTSAKNFTTSSISSATEGLNSTITQTASGIIAQVNAINMVANSEFDPTDEGWYTIGTTAGNPLGVKAAPGYITTSFGDWELSGGSQLIVYNSGTWYSTEPKQATSGVLYSASIIAGRTGASTAIAFDLRIAWFDADKKLIGYASAGNPINTTSYVGIKQITLENQTSPANTKFVSLVIAHSGAVVGGSDIIGRPMLNRGSKIGTYSPTYGSTYTSTQLTLLKDNWSIGIASNTGAIASGIAADSNAMNIVSPKVIISSPQTQITGTAWIKTAMIADGQISTAKIGDASITSAKILNLDVDKVTGNTSNWVLSQWTSATGNKVTIDGNGMYFSPGTSRMTTYGFEAWRRESAGNYAAMGMLGSYAWETDQDINGVGLIAKYYGVPHDDPNGPWKGEAWGGDTIAIGALEPQIGRGYNYVTPYMIFPSSNGIGDKYFPGNGNDTIIMSRWLSIYTGLNMRGHSIVNSSGYSLKENFNPVSGLEALDIFDNTEIMTYDYKPDSEDMDSRTLANMQNKVGFVINDNGESPFKTDSRLIRYGNTRDDSVTVGYLMAAVKELNQNIKQLNEEIRQLKGEPAT